MKQSIFGIGDTLSKVTGSLNKGVAMLSMDQEFIESRKKKSQDAPRHVGEGILAGAKGLAGGVWQGVSGVVLDPVRVSIA